MSNLLTATITIEGTRPLLFHRFSPEALPLTKKETKGVAGNQPDEWKQTVLMTAERQLYLPGTYFFSCLRNAAQYAKAGRNTLHRKVASTLQVLSDIALIDNRFVPEDPVQLDLSVLPNETPPVYLSVTGVRNPATKARNVRYRIAAAPGWSCQFQIGWDITVVDRDLMQSICIDAGRLVGLADARLIGYGRFEVIDYQLGDTS